VLHGAGTSGRADANRNCYVENRVSLFAGDRQDLLFQSRRDKETGTSAQRRDPQSEAFGCCAASPFVQRDQIGGQFQSQCDGFRFTGIETRFEYACDVAGPGVSAA